MNNDIQVNDVVESLKNIIADQAYKIAYREAIIASYEREIARLNKALQQAHQDKSIQVVGANDNDGDVR